MIGAGIGDSLDVLLHLLLLAQGVILEFFAAGDEHGALGLRGGGVHGAAEHGNLGVLHVLHGSLHVAANHHPLHNLVLVQRGSDDLRHPDVVHVEVELVLGAHVDARLRAGLRQDALVPELLGGEGTLDAGGDGVGVANVQRLRPGDDELLHPLERLLHRLLVPFDDLRRVETVADELLGVAKQLTAEGHHQVGAVANLLLLRLRRHHQKFGSRVRDFELADDDRRVGGDEELVEVVDDHLVHACGFGCRGRGTKVRIFAFGLSERRPRLASSIGKETSKS